jgi:nucleoside-diphosphate-sugar epimerase
VILITGGTGFIGSYLIKQLLAYGKSVRAIKRHHSIIPKNLKNNSKIEWVDADLSDYFSLQDAFNGVNEVYHCAALVSYDPKDKKQLFKTNVEGTTHIVNLCQDYQVRLIYVSSVAALGNNEKNKVITERTHWVWSKTKSSYSISKYEAEREVWRGIAEGLNAVIVNPSIVIGPSNGKSESGRIFKLLEKGLNFYPTGSAGFVDVEDVVKIMIALMEKVDITESSFILNATNVSYHELFSKYALISGKKPPKYRANQRLMGLAWRFVAICNLLGIKHFGLTKEIALASVKKNAYSNQKIIELLDYSFKPLEKSLEDIHSSMQ